MSDLTGHRSNFPSLIGTTKPSLKSGTHPVVDVAAVSIAQQFASVQLNWVDLEFDETTKALWLYMKSEGRPCFTPELLSELAQSQAVMKRLFETYQPADPCPINFKVVASRIPGVYNLGGDLNLFIQLIREKDREKLHKYAVDCIDVVYRNAISSNLPIVTIGMIQGDALGGGFETALSCDVIIAERQAKFGLPEVLFNLFPGMGAYSFLSRMVDGRVAEKMLMSGRLYSAEELHEMGIVHEVVEEGQAPFAVQQYITKNARKHTAHSAIYRAGRTVQPVAYEELIDVVEIWVDAALSLSDQDLKKMERLTKAQDRLGAPSVRKQAF
ncbi:MULTISPECIES: crotonase/enoyl-CoA hydratase family protein [unclassified Pseudovibrio]|uniref:crotonase/enoyl-CoA hydratase family protein n=1 Tax=unclassified Pseudovibrio TaxID=2627060 RepID=UPI0007AEC2A5|nr:MULTISPECIES: crotonase/enoyl-CoA hydratase family protein [unclassified Pseudovibrio]KZL03063.1 2,3-dehydroadipyl-CoA hydratase [Pseudovibrio sp. W74]KZL04918.1 2,3-dehydroadipyl-CoA hydratase [Pseudovibrio sp. Ad14]